MAVEGRGQLQLRRFKQGGNAHMQCSCMSWLRQSQKSSMSPLAHEAWVCTWSLVIDPCLLELVLVLLVGRATSSVCTHLLDEAAGLYPRSAVLFCESTINHNGRPCNAVRVRNNTRLRPLTSIQRSCCPSQPCTSCVSITVSLLLLIVSLLLL